MLQPCVAANDLFFSLAVNQLEGLSVSAFRGLSSMINANEFNSIIAGILGTPVRKLLLGAYRTSVCSRCARRR